MNTSGILEVFHAGAWGSFCQTLIRSSDDNDNDFSSFDGPVGPRLPGTEVCTCFRRLPSPVAQLVLPSLSLLCGLAAVVATSWMLTLSV